MNREFIKSVYQKQGPPPYHFKVALSEDTLIDPETKELTTVYMLVFHNSDYQKLSEDREKFTQVAQWLVATHNAIRSYGVKVIIQPIFDSYDNLTPDQLKYKLQEIIKKS